MKYPQLVPMPSAVQDWLDEQLEARGIDAVVYTRYILSLLQRDTFDLPDDLLTLSPGKGKEVGRRGRKRGRREDHWDVWDREQLKRSAAVECLMSASDQKFGIEKLVDELCIKLKEIQSQGESVHLELTETTASPEDKPNSPSPQDQAQKYYAAFPPLGGKSEAGESVPALESSVWGGGVRRGEGSSWKEVGHNKGGRTAMEAEQRHPRPRSPSLNELDQLIAKFDHSIEALWSPPGPSPTVVAPPTPRGQTSVQQPNSFIQCGTNITSSIWSHEAQVPDGAWNKLETLPSLFAGGLPWADPSAPRWSDADSYSLFGESRSQLAGSLAVLNHSRHGSGFMEVVPPSRGAAAAPREEEPAPTVAPEPPGDEEDLLTSARTHFRPIRHDGGDRYADGTTFQVTATLASVEYRRSSSGGLYLDGEGGPVRYLEYRCTDPFGPLVPKFRVCPTEEKCCQTEETEDAVASSDEDAAVDVKRSRQEQFYFPGDEQLAEEAVVQHCPSCHTWGSSTLLSLNPGWLGKSNRSWYDIWSGSAPSPACQACSGPACQQQSSKLREELSRDGEQLLSDLSFVRHLYSGSDWLNEDTPDWAQQQGEELEMFGGDPGCCTHSLPASHHLSKKMDDHCWSSPRGTLSASVQLEPKWKLNERPSVARATHADRKRRHSASQKVCPRSKQPLCNRPNCRLPHDGGWDPPGIKGHALRPVTL